MDEGMGPITFFGQTQRYGSQLQQHLRLYANQSVEQKPMEQPAYADFDHQPCKKCKVKRSTPKALRCIEHGCSECTRWGTRPHNYICGIPRDDSDNRMNSEIIMGTEKECMACRMEKYSEKVQKTTLSKLSMGRPIPKRCYPMDKLVIEAKIDGKTTSVHVSTATGISLVDLSMLPAAEVEDYGEPADLRCMTGLVSGERISTIGRASLLVQIGEYTKYHTFHVTRQLPKGQIMLGYDFLAEFDKVWIRYDIKKMYFDSYAATIEPKRNTCRLWDVIGNQENQEQFAMNIFCSRHANLLRQDEEKVHYTWYNGERPGISMMGTVNGTAERMLVDTSASQCMISSTALDRGAEREQIPPNYEPIKVYGLSSSGMTTIGAADCEIEFATQTHIIRCHVVDHMPGEHQIILGSDWLSMHESILFDNEDESCSFDDDLAKTHYLGEREIGLRRKYHQVDVPDIWVIGTLTNEPAGDCEEHDDLPNWSDMTSSKQEAESQRRDIMNKAFDLFDLPHRDNYAAHFEALVGKEIFDLCRKVPSVMEELMIKAKIGSTNLLIRVHTSAATSLVDMEMLRTLIKTDRHGVVMEKEPKQQIKEGGNITLCMEIGDLKTSHQFHITKNTMNKNAVLGYDFIRKFDRTMINYKTKKLSLDYHTTRMGSRLDWMGRTSTTGMDIQSKICFTTIDERNSGLMFQNEINGSPHLTVLDPSSRYSLITKTAANNCNKKRSVLKGANRIGIQGINPKGEMSKGEVMCEIQLTHTTSYTVCNVVDQLPGDAQILLGSNWCGLFDMIILDEKEARMIMNGTTQGRFNIINKKESQGQMKDGTSNDTWVIGTLTTQPAGDCGKHDQLREWVDETQEENGDKMMDNKNIQMNPADEMTKLEKQIDPPKHDEFEFEDFYIEDPYVEEMKDTWNAPNGKLPLQATPPVPHTNQRQKNTARTAHILLALTLPAANGANTNEGMSTSQGWTADRALQILAPLMMLLTLLAAMIMTCVCSWRNRKQKWEARNSDPEKGNNRGHQVIKTPIIAAAIMAVVMFCILPSTWALFPNDKNNGKKIGPLFCLKEHGRHIFALPKPYDCDYTFNATMNMRTVNLTLYKENLVLYRSEAHLCQKKKTYVTTYENVMGGKSITEAKNEHLSVSFEECQRMTEFKRCGKQSLRQFGLIEATDNQIKPTYTGWGFNCCTNTEVAVENCFLSKTTVFKRHGETEFESTAGNVRHCTYSDGKCQLTNGDMLTWEIAKQENCQYIQYEVEQGTLMGNSWLSDSANLALTWLDRRTTTNCDGKRVDISDQGFPFTINTKDGSYMSLDDFITQPADKTDKNFKPNRYKRGTSASRNRYAFTHQKKGETNVGGFVSESQLNAKLQASAESLARDLRSLFQHTMGASCQLAVQRMELMNANMLREPTMAVRKLLNRDDLIAAASSTVVEVWPCHVMQKDAYVLLPMNKTCTTYIPIGFKIGKDTHHGFMDPLTNVVHQSALPTDCDGAAEIPLDLHGETVLYRSLNGQVTLERLEPSQTLPIKRYNPSLELKSDHVIFRPMALHGWFTMFDHITFNDKLDYFQNQAAVLSHIGVQIKPNLKEAVDISAGNIVATGLLSLWGHFFSWSLVLIWGAVFLTYAKLIISIIKVIIKWHLGIPPGVGAFQQIKRSCANKINRVSYGAQKLAKDVYHRRDGHGQPDFVPMMNSNEEFHMAHQNYIQSQRRRHSSVPRVHFQSQNGEEEEQVATMQQRLNTPRVREISEEEALQQPIRRNGSMKSILARPTSAISATPSEASDMSGKCNFAVLTHTESIQTPGKKNTMGMVALCKLNGTTLAAQMDTGASISLIDSRILKTLKYATSYKRHTRYLKGIVPGEVIQTMGVAIIHLEMGSFKTTQEFHITPYLPNGYCMIGFDVLGRFDKITLYNRKNRICIDQHSVPMYTIAEWRRRQEDYHTQLEIIKEKQVQYKPSLHGEHRCDNDKYGTKGSHTSEGGHLGILALVKLNETTMPVYVDTAASLSLVTPAALEKGMYIPQVDTGDTRRMGGVVPQKAATTTGSADCKLQLGKLEINHPFHITNHLHHAEAFMGFDLVSRFDVVVINNKAGTISFDGHNVMIRTVDRFKTEKQGQNMAVANVVCAVDTILPAKMERRVIAEISKPTKFQCSDTVEYVPAREHLATQVGAIFAAASISKISDQCTMPVHLTNALNEPRLIKSGTYLGQVCKIKTMAPGEKTLAKKVTWKDDKKTEIDMGTGLNRTQWTEMCNTLVSTPTSNGTPKEDNPTTTDATWGF